MSNSSLECPISDHDLKCFLLGHNRDGRAVDVADLRSLIEHVIAKIESDHAALWDEFEKETLDAIGAEVVGVTIDAGADIPGMIRRLHERYRVEIQREQARRIEAEEQRDTYKRLANMKRKAAK